MTADERRQLLRRDQARAPLDALARARLSRESQRQAGPETMPHCTAFPPPVVVPLPHSLQSVVNVSFGLLLNASEVELVHDAGGARYELTVRLQLGDTSVGYVTAWTERDHHQRPAWVQDRVRETCDLLIDSLRIRGGR